MNRPRFTLVIFSDSGRSARQLRVNRSSLLGYAALSMSMLGVALWLGWTIGELTARL